MDRKTAIIIISLLFIPSIGMLDEITGSELSLTVFYLVPIMSCTWFGGVGAGIGAAILALASYAAADLVFTNPLELPKSLLEAWALAEKFVFFAVAVFVAKALRGRLDEERKRALRDYVTGLPNRRSFASALDAARTTGKPFSLSFIEIEGLDELALGHGEHFAEGLVRELGSIACRKLPAYRYRDDRIAILLPETGGPTAVSRIASLIETLGTDNLARRGLDIRFKVAIAFCEDTSRASPQHLARFLADHMREVRSREGNQLEFYQFC